MSQTKNSNEQIATIIQQAKDLGLSYKEAADRFGLPVWKIYEYNKAQKKNDKQTPKQTPDPSIDSSQEKTEQSSTQTPEVNRSQDNETNGLPEQVKQLIIHYREHHPEHGFKRIEQYLQNTYFLVIPRKKIRQVLKEAGLLEHHDSSFDKKGSSNEPKAIRRFEAAGPRVLYQMDITYVYIKGIKVLYLINLIDDYSRFCLSSSLQFDQSADTLIEVLHQAIELYGQPKKLLTDQGRAFYTWSAEKTKFQHYLDDMHIEHILTDPHHPTTTGKVERFHQTLKNELIRKVKFKNYLDAVEKIESYIYHYNYERPHQGLDGVRPADRFMGVSVSQSLARHDLLSRELVTGKAYLVFKVGAHEICIVHLPDQEPKIIVNGACYAAHNTHRL